MNNTQAVLPDSLTVLARGWLSSNVILARGADNTLIDTGYWTDQADTLAWVQAALGQAPLHRVINTHLHSDHCGGNAFLKYVFPSLDISVSSLASHKVAHWLADELTYDYSGQHCPPFMYTSLLSPDDVTEFGHLQWQAIHSPGHDDDSVVLYNAEEKILISGDALWEHGFGILFTEAALDGQQQFLDTIAELDIRLVIPGHGLPFTTVDAALKKSFQRLAFFKEHPDKQAHVAGRNILMFLLLEKQRMHWPDMRQTLSGLQAIRDIHTKYPLKAEPLALVDHYAQELVQQSMARWDGEALALP